MLGPLGWHCHHVGQHVYHKDVRRSWAHPDLSLKSCQLLPGDVPCCELGSYFLLRGECVGNRHSLCLRRREFQQMMSEFDLPVQQRLPQQQA